MRRQTKPITIKALLLSALFLTFTVFISCKKNDEGMLLANEISLVGEAAFTVLESDTDITVTYEFAVPARKDGSATISVQATDLTYGVNYTTSPAEEDGEIILDFEEDDAELSFVITIIDDNLNLPNGTVEFSLASIDGEEADFTSATYTLTIQDNEGETILPASSETLQFGDVVPGTSTDAQEVTFSTINVVSGINAEASSGFQVSATSDGTYSNVVVLDAAATSVFVKAAPSAEASLGELTGTVTLTSGDGTATVNVRAIKSATVGKLFWVENFDYPVDETYPSYGTKGSNWGVIPSSARYRMAVASTPGGGITGLQRTGVFDTWYSVTRLTGISMGDNPLSFTGYPNSGVGRTALLALDRTNHTWNPNLSTCTDQGDFLAKNAQYARRFVDNGSEITSGTVFFSALIKVNAVFDDALPVLKNAIMMLTGDATFVNTNAMKLNVRKDGAGFNFGVSKSGDDGTVVYGSTTYEVGTTYAVVFKVEIVPDVEGDGPNDIVSVYVYEPGETIPTYESGNEVPEARIDATNQDVDVHDVTTGLEVFFFREVADVFSAPTSPSPNKRENIEVQNVEFSGIRVGTTWSALFQSDSKALYDSQSGDALQTQVYGQPLCPLGPPLKLGNIDQ